MQGKFKRFLSYYKPYIAVFLIDMLCALVVAAVELIFPLMVRNIVNQGIDPNVGIVLDVIFKIGAVLLFMRIVDAACNYYINSYGHIMGAKMEADMRRDLYDHMQKLSFSYYDNAKIGQLMSRITNDLFDITELAHHGPEEIFISSMKVIGAFVILLNVNVALTLIIFAFLPLMTIFSIRYNKKMHKAFMSNRVKIAEINSQVEDSLSGIRVVQSFASEELELEKFDRGNESFLKTKRDSYKYMGIFNTGIRFFDAIMNISVIVIGAIFVKQGLVNIGDLIAYLLYIGTLLGAIRTLVQFTEQFQRGITGFERFLEILDTDVDIADSHKAIALHDVKGEIEFVDVGFKYAENLDYVLSGLDLKMHKGDNVAIVGPSGGGKTTLCALIPRFYDVTSGEILIDGHNIKDVKLKSLRKNIGMVQQDVYLFNGSVSENIAYGNPEATMEEIIEAAKNANAHEFITELTDGYDTYVGERGVKLSGGQKQRISIARVFLKNPPVLILDEATSALDNESENVVQQSLERLTKGRTTLTIAHRLSTIRNASTILLLTENGIEEKGTHQELLNKDGMYAKLYNMQFEGRQEDELSELVWQDNMS